MLLLKLIAMSDSSKNNVDNPAFTIASAAELLALANSFRVQEGQPINETWDIQVNDIDFPVAPSGITLEYNTMNNSVEVKQADVVLLTYPLDYSRNNYTSSHQLLDLDFVSVRECTLTIRNSSFFSIQTDSHPMAQQ